MRVSRPLAAVVFLAFVLIDLILCSIFYVQNDHISLSHNATLPVYDVRTSQLDHCLLALIRSAILLGGLIGVCYNPSAATDRISSGSLWIVCICLTMAVFSPFKLLTLAETTDDFRLPWFWSLFGWNMTASAICALIWSLILAKITISNPRAVAIDGNTIVQDDSAGLIENEIVENGSQNRSAGNREDGKKEGEKDKEKDEESKFNVKETTSQLWRLIKYTKAEWYWYTIGFIFLVFYSAARIFIPYFTGRVISDVVVLRSYSQLLKSVGIMAGLAVGSALFAGLRGSCFQYAIAKMGTRIRGELFLSLVKQEIGFFDVTKTGDITSRLSADCQSVSDAIAYNFNIFLRNSIMLMGTLAFMFKLSWRLTVMTFIAIPIIGVVTKIYGKFYERLSKEAQDSLAKANEVAEEVLSSMRTVRSFANELGESKRYDAKLNEVLKVRTKQTYAFLGYMWINELFDLLLLIAVLWYGGYLVLTNKLKSEDMIAYLLYQMQLGEALSLIGWVFTGLMQAVGASGKVFEWLDRKPEVPNDGREELGQVSGRVEFKDVSFSYPSRPKVDVLTGVNFKAEPGEIVALVGPSGGGKSSCIALLEHFYEPKSGVVLLDGIPVQRIDHAFFHRAVSLVSQEPVLFARSISENISYGLDTGDWSQEDVIRCSILANAHDFIDAMPTAYETDVGEKGVQLSGGQKQRIAIARALIRKPKVLLLDEATSALDAESEYLVKQAIHKNLSGHTVLLIAHRLSTVEKADKIVVIDKGRVVQEGTHKGLVQQDGLYRNLVHRQLLGEQTEDRELPLAKTKSFTCSATANKPVPACVVVDPLSSLSPTRLLASSI